MPFTWLILILAAIAVVGYQMGHSRALKSAGGDRRNLHSLPVYYGANVAMWAIVPAATVAHHLDVGTAVFCKRPCA